VEVVEGKERSQCRQDLLVLAQREQEIMEASTGKVLSTYETPLTVQERDCLARKMAGELQLLRREEYSCTREFFRLGNYMTRLKKDEAAGAHRDGMDARAELSGLAASDSGLRTGMPQNEGDSEDVDENKSTEKNASPVRHPAPSPKTDLSEQETVKNTVATAAPPPTEAATALHP